MSLGVLRRAWPQPGASRQHIENRVGRRGYRARGEPGPVGGHSLDHPYWDGVRVAAAGKRQLAVTCNTEGSALRSCAERAILDVSHLAAYSAAGKIRRGVWPVPLAVRGPSSSEETVALVAEVAVTAVHSGIPMMPIFVRVELDHGWLARPMVGRVYITLRRDSN